MTSQIEGASDESSSASEDLPGSATPAEQSAMGVAPTNPTSIPDIIAALRGIDALQGLPNAYIYIRWVVPLIELPIQRGPFPLFLREQYGQVFQADPSTTGQTIHGSVPN